MPREKYCGNSQYFFALRAVWKMTNHHTKNDLWLGQVFPDPRGTCQSPLKPVST